MTTRAAPADTTSAPAPSHRRTRRLHWPSAAVLVLGLALTVALTIGSVVSIHDAQDRLLRAQLRQVGAALEAAIPAFQQPLVAADRIASTVGVGAFRTFAQSNVGRGAPFRSITLWRVTAHGATLVARVGPRPALLAHHDAARFLIGVPPSAVLTVTALLDGRVKGLGLAERLPGRGTPLVVYAESPLPATSRVTFPSTSPFAGLTFALYFGHAVVPRALMETSVRLPVRPPTASAVVSFGSADVTVVATLLGRSGVLPPSVPWGIAVGGTVLTAAATTATERLVRRRERAERGAEAHRVIAETLQQSLLPDGGPGVPGVEVAGRYVSGTAELSVGGDWYDVIRIDDAHLFLAVGDVSGRGLRAATVMGTLRHAIRAYAVQGDDAATVIRKLDELVDVGRDGCFATVLCVDVDVPSRRVQLASAGHPPALVVDGAGARFVVTPANTPVGVPYPGAVASTTLVLAEGAALLVYTDGLVERRDRSLDDGLERLRVTAVSPPTPMEDELHAIVTGLVPDGAGDDLALLGVRFETTTAHAEVGADDEQWRRLGPMAAVAARSFPDAPGSAAAARGFALDTLAGIAADDREVVALLVSELATNAMLHAGSPFTVIVVDDRSTGRLRVGVRDDGGGTPVRQRPWPLAPRGRGLRIVDELSAVWGVEWAGDGAGKTVWFELAPTRRATGVARAPIEAT